MIRVFSIARIIRIIKRFLSAVLFLSGRQELFDNAARFRFAAAAAGTDFRHFLHVFKTLGAVVYGLFQIADGYLSAVADGSVQIAFHVFLLCIFCAEKIINDGDKTRGAAAISATSSARRALFSEWSGQRRQ